MEKKKIKIGISGVSGISQTMHLPTFQKMENVEIAALCDTNINRAKWIAHNFNIPHVFSDFSEMIETCDLDVVDICTPVQQHLPEAIAALQRDVHVMIEKPFALNVQDAEQIVDMAQKHKRKLMAMMNLRFRPDAIALKSILSNSKIGDILYLKSGWLRRNEKWHQELNLRQGPIMRLGLQIIDLSLWLLGDPNVMSVKAVSFYKNTNSKIGESALIYMHLESGAVLTVEIGWNARFGKDFLYCNIVGDKGIARLNPLTLLKEQHKKLVDITPSQSYSKGRPFLKSYENEIAHFIFCVVNDKEIQSRGREIIGRLKIIEAVNKSIDTGKEVKLG